MVPPASTAQGAAVSTHWAAGAGLRVDPGPRRLQLVLHRVRLEDEGAKPAKGVGRRLPLARGVDARGRSRIHGQRELQQGRD